MKKVITAFLVGGILSAVFIVTQIVHAQNVKPPLPPEPPSPPQAPSRATERVIVQFRSFTPQSVRQNEHQKLGTQEIESLKQKNTVVVRVPHGEEVAYAKSYQNSFWVDYAEPDDLAYALEVTNDPNFSEQWGLEKIHASNAWEFTHAGSVHIAILDTGIAQNHPDLTSKVDKWANFTRSRTNYDQNGHGSHVAGIAAATTNNNLGIAGTGYDARLFSAKVLDDGGSGYYSSIANGIYWAADNGANVINMSLGGTSGSKTLENAINYSWSKGVVLVAAAGNTGNNQLHYPAYYEKVIAVAATDQEDRIASFSTRNASWVDVAAPGVDILSTIPKSGYDSWSGTSMSAPYVSGLVGLVKAEFSGESNSQIRNRIETSADDIPGTGSYWSEGRINAYAALSAGILEPIPTPTAVPPTPTPTPSQKPSWCRYIPTHRLCQ